MSKTRAAFDLCLATDAETSGIALGCVDPTFNPETGERYQALSFGFVVADVRTFKPVDELYIEIQYDESKYVWSEGAQRVHGLTQEYLKANALSRQEAAFKVKEFIEKYFGPFETIRKLVLLGQNVATFDRYFLIDLLETIGEPPQFGNRHIDTFSLGIGTLGVFSSDELFEVLGLQRDPNKHNALEDTKHALKAARLIKNFIQAA